MSSPEQNEKLARALREAEERTRIFIPPAVNQAILKRTHEHFQTAPKAAPASWSAALKRRFWIFAAPALAAIVLTFIFLSHRVPQFAREDINHDGHVDIIDALALAKSLENKTASDGFDQNGDQKLDESDVNTVAMAAVRLDRKPGT